MLNARIRKAFAPTVSVATRRAEIHARPGDEASARGEAIASARADVQGSPHVSELVSSVRVSNVCESGSFALDVDFSAPPGVTILFGASGAGKTQTLKAIAGLVHPDEGLITVDVQTLFDSSRGINVAVSRRRVGYVFQNLALFPHMTAQENVEFAIGNLPRRVRRERALSLLERFKVGHTAHRRPRAISGGEAQRVALARALAGEPRLLLLDEPLSALDEAIKLDIIADLKEMNRKLRLPILYVTHSREEALTLGERALVLERGRVVAEGEPHEVFGAPVKASVARLVGVENIFEGLVLSRNEDAGTMLVELRAEAEAGSACRVEVPLGSAREGERVCVAVSSGDILLAAAEPRGLSARNVLAGRVVRVERRAEQMLVHVSCGVTWSASVTRQSVEELRIETGKTIWLAFKTYSCRILDS
ncbi:MAG TPA: ATP-binding cassette domain-containing protein [Pyrinomonadaceae bacterium]|jgi:molybdate transport system ATP-binding protein|nr:ATP-binding cassette domain-containing protein [Pyrinomonadaceae bacterium]